MAESAINLFKLFLLIFITSFNNVTPTINPVQTLWESPEDHKLLPVVDFEEYWKGPENLGQIAGVAVDLSGKPVVFHRASRIWSYNTFDDRNVYQQQYMGPIMENTVITLDPIFGKVLHGWGNQTFYLPHGIHIDLFGNVWLTDVALHQVFKYSSSGVLQLVLGRQFEPGNDLDHFCQPTSVAVASTGQIVVADGYCNNRIVLFDSQGNPKFTVGEQLNLVVPHAVTILLDQEVCVADRENSRIVCMNVGLPGSEFSSEYPYAIEDPLFGRMFGIASYGDIIYAVTGKTPYKINAGFTINSKTRKIISSWGPVLDTPFSNPHAIAVSPDGNTVYVSEIGPNKLWKFARIQKLSKGSENSIY
ncbi:peptidyl-alpha-hydroxyglycine alpha-amidating lyase 2-like [Prorops nasuta]|uniref:peptidyl-alpha-hydroxyglycine alpha-amidating lyase 2-like n=1 Tax=Prorops nasuta TaxID=863751 RepID=UPI0034CDD326